MWSTLLDSVPSAAFAALMVFSFSAGAEPMVSGFTASSGEDLGSGLFLAAISAAPGKGRIFDSSTNGLAGEIFAVPPDAVGFTGRGGVGETVGFWFWLGAVAVGPAGGTGPMFSWSSPNSFHSSTSSRSCEYVASAQLLRSGSNHMVAHTPSTNPSFTSPGILRLPARLCHSLLAFSSVAVSIAWNGILFAFKMVSRREVAVMICELPAVKEVYRKSLGSFSSSLRSCAPPAIVCGYLLRLKLLCRSYF